MPIPSEDIVAGGTYGIYQGVSYEVTHIDGRNVHFQTWMDGKKYGQLTHMDIESFAEKATHRIQAADDPDATQHVFQVTVPFTSRLSREEARKELLRHIGGKHGVGQITVT